MNVNIYLSGGGGFNVDLPVKNLEEVSNLLWNMGADRTLTVFNNVIINSEYIEAVELVG